MAGDTSSQIFMIRVAKSVLRSLGLVILKDARSMRTYFLSPPVIWALKFLLITFPFQDSQPELCTLKRALTVRLYQLVGMTSSASHLQSSFTIQMKKLDVRACNLDPLVLRALRIRSDDTSDFLFPNFVLTEALLDTWDGSDWFPPMLKAQRFECLLDACRECSIHMADILRVLRILPQHQLGGNVPLCISRWTQENINEFIHLFKLVYKANLQLTPAPSGPIPGPSK